MGGGSWGRGRRNLLVDYMRSIFGFFGFFEDIELRFQPFRLRIGSMRLFQCSLRRFFILFRVALSRRFYICGVDISNFSSKSILFSNQYHCV